MLSDTDLSVWNHNNNQEYIRKYLEYEQKKAFLKNNTNTILLDLYDTLIRYPKSIPESLKKQIKAWNLNRDLVNSLYEVAQINNEDLKSLNDIHHIITNKDAINALVEYTNNNAANVRIYWDTIDALNILKNEGFNIWVVSNLWKEYVQPFRDKFPKWFFDYEILSCLAWLKKPNKEIFNKILDDQINFGKKNEDKLSEDEAKKFTAMVWNKLNEDIVFAENALIPGILMNRKADRMSYDDKRWLIIIHTLYDLLDIFWINHQYSNY